jgi:exodeoxyribonuclease X
MLFDTAVLQTLWSRLSFAVCDVESNGQQPPELIELAVVPIDGGMPGVAVSWLVRPIRGVSARVVGIHGIRTADLSSAPRVEEVRPAMLSALGGRYIVAHNAGVDWSILRRALPDLEVPGVIDTLRLARAVAPALPSYRLSDLVQTLDLACGQFGSAHRAAYDAFAAMSLFRYLMQRHGGDGMTLEELLSFGRLRSASASVQQKLF